MTHTTHPASATASLTRRSFLALASAAGAGSALVGCASTGDDMQATTSEAAGSDVADDTDVVIPTELEIDMGNWSYNEDDDVYYQLNVAYCSNPISERLETLGIFVPGAYFEAKAHGRVFSCTVKEDAQIGAYTPSTAPILIPINAGDFASQSAPTSYEAGSISDYLSQGIIYVYPGLRGRSSAYESSTNTYITGGAPWGLVDAKAVVRFLRLNAHNLPGSCEHIIAAGHGAGGTLSMLLGATGNSTLFEPYLQEIGAAEYDIEGNTASDTIYASASWCPIIPTDSANGAYEWMMGQYSSQDSRATDTFTYQLSCDLANEWAEHLNTLGLSDSTEQLLELNDTQGAIYGAGSYYEYLVRLIEDSFAAFAQQAEAPISIQTLTQVSAAFPGGSTTDASSAAQSTESDLQTNQQSYESLEAYLNALNADYRWLDFSFTTSEARLANLSAYVGHCRVPTQAVGAFDALERTQSTNQLFGVDSNESLHYDEATAQLLMSNQELYAAYADWDSSYPEAFASDLAELDAMGFDMQTRQNMYNPLYFLSSTAEGFGTADVAQHWRINTGMQQDSTTLVHEANVALCLEAYDSVSSCVFTPVWNAGCVPCERSGSYTENLISWIESCCAE